MIKVPRKTLQALADILQEHCFYNFQHFYDKKGRMKLFETKEQKKENKVFKELLDLLETKSP